MTFEAIETAPLWRHPSDLAAEVERLRELSETLKQQAQIHAQEARTLNAIIGEIYQLCTSSTGEPGNWNGAEPVRKLVAEVERLKTELAKAREELAALPKQEPIGSSTSDGAIWFDKNPHAFPVGTEFYAAPQPRSPADDAVRELA